MRSQGVAFKEYNIETNISKRNELWKKAGRNAWVPVIDVEGTIIRGYDPDEIKAALDRAAGER